MRSDISINRTGWLYALDYRKVIIIALLLRVIFASAYDVFVSVTDRDVLLPDSKYYSTTGEYIAFLLDSHTIADMESYFKGKDAHTQFIFFDTLKYQKGHFIAPKAEAIIYIYIIGVIYFIFGHLTILVRFFNIFLSIMSVYFIFMIAKRKFGDLTANLFLLFALFLPAHFMYSITLSRDFVRVFVVTFILWLLYGGIIWKRSKKE
ncbi:MAG: hypothetical protein PHS46_03160 [Candidatus Omnitrophica bacterium]|nr:hypothetical protein [Candidatus Omnitrophota bacterium]